MVYKFFDKKSAGSGVTALANKSALNNEILKNEQLADESHKPILKKIKKKQFFLHLKAIFGVLI